MFHFCVGGISPFQMDLFSKLKKLAYSADRACCRTMFTCIKCSRILQDREIREMFMHTNILQIKSFQTSTNMPIFPLRILTSYEAKIAKIYNFWTFRHVIKLNILQSLKHRLPRSSLEVIYLSFIRPIMEYADVVWDHMTDQDCTLLENIQLAAARVVTGAIRYTSHAKIYEECGWDTLQARREKHKLALFHKIIHKDTPAYLYDHIPPTVGTRAGRPLRNNSNFTLIKTYKDYFDNSFFPETVRLWNNLDEKLKSVASYESFIKLLNKPTIQIPKHYYSGSRKPNIILARLRMGCSELNDDLYRIGVTGSPACSCGARRENPFHFFMTCPNYTFIRQQLHAEIITLSKYSIGTILYGDKTKSDEVNRDIVNLVHNFIIDSNRFQ